MSPILFQNINISFFEWCQFYGTLQKSWLHCHGLYVVVMIVVPRTWVPVISNFDPVNLHTPPPSSVSQHKSQQLNSSLLVSIRLTPSRPVIPTVPSDKLMNYHTRTLSCTSRVLVLHSFPGFCRLRMHNKGGSPVAFVEYQDARFASQVMAALQGSFLLSSDRGPIRIEYAKSKMASEVGFSLFCLFSTLTRSRSRVDLHPNRCRQQLVFLNHSSLFLTSTIFHHIFPFDSCSPQHPLTTSSNIL